MSRLRFYFSDSKAPAHLVVPAAVPRARALDRVQRAMRSSLSPTAQSAAIGHATAPRHGQRALLLPTASGARGAPLPRYDGPAPRARKNYWHSTSTWPRHLQNRARGSALHWQFRVRARLHYDIQTPTSNILHSFKRLRCQYSARDKSFLLRNRAPAFPTASTT